MHSDHFSSHSLRSGANGGLDYASTKGAITQFTKSLTQQQASKGIRINAVAQASQAASLGQRLRPIIAYNARAAATPVMNW
ncbi:hypothetical protein NU219Hw_g4124t1 [Hortaea werneckii]